MQKIDFNNGIKTFNRGGHDPISQTHREILDGNPQLVPTSGTKHQFLSLKIAVALLTHVESRNLGRVLQAPCDVVLSREFVIQPDIAFIGKGRSGLIGEKSMWGPPDLIVEILSRETRERDRIMKRKIYSRFEVKEYWMADLDFETIEVLLWSELGYASAGIYDKSQSLSSPALPEIKLPLGKVFG